MTKHSSALLLEIDSELYRLHLAGQAWELVRLQGKRQGAIYVVGPGHCNCPDAIFRNTTCKHQTAMVEQGLIRQEVRSERGSDTAM
jgi:hypothetical protein